MESLVQPDRLRARILLWARGDAGTVLGTGERQTHRVISGLLEKGVLVSQSQRSPLRLAFPATFASRWMPGLFPDKVD